MNQIKKGMDFLSLYTLIKSSLSWIFVGRWSDDHLHRGHPPTVNHVQIGARVEQSAKNPRRAWPTSPVQSGVAADAPPIGVCPEIEQNLSHLPVFAIGAHKERSLTVSIQCFYRNPWKSRQSHN